MKVIAVKKKSIGGLYFFVTLLGIGFIAIGSMHIYILLMGVMIFALGIGITIDFSKLPKEVIKFDGNSKLYLPKNVTLNLNEITDVSYRRASAKGIQYKWGKIIIKTKGNSFKYNYIQDCENTAKELTKLVYTHNGLN